MKTIQKSAPLTLNDSCLLYSLKRTIAIKKSNLNEAEIFADSSDFYLDKKNSVNLEARNKYYSLMLQKEIDKTKLSIESRWKTNLIFIIAFVALNIIALLFYIFLQNRKQMREKIEEESKIHRIEVDHKERQIAIMRNFLLSKINIIQKLQSISTSSRKKIILSPDDWKEIEIFLNNTDDEFVERLKNQFQELTMKDIQFLMLIKLKIPYESIAVIYNIEEKSVKQRLFLFKSKLRLSTGQMSTRKFIEGY